MKTSLLSLFFALFILSLKAQNPAFWIQPNLFNPSTAGAYNKLAANGFINQGSFNGGFGLNYNQAVKSIHGGIGASLEADYSGTQSPFFYNNLRSTVNYSYHAKLSDKLLLTLGAGVSYYKDNGYEWASSALPPLTVNRDHITGNIGTSLIANRWNIGLSFMNYNSTQNFHSFIFNGGYRFDLGENFTIKPCFQYSNYANGFQNLQVSAVPTWKNKFWISPGFQNRDGFNVGIGYDHKNKIRAGFFYSVTVSELNNGISGGNFQFNLSYRIKKD